jgi:hypothetical protein
MSINFHKRKKKSQGEGKGRKLAIDQLRGGYALYSIPMSGFRLAWTIVAVGGEATK